MRDPDSYRSNRKRLAKSQKLIWRELPRRQVIVSQKVAKGTRGSTVLMVIVPKPNPLPSGTADSM